MIGGTARVWHAFVFQILGQIARDVTRAVIRQQARTMNDVCLIKPCFFQRLVQRVLNI